MTTKAAAYGRSSVNTHSARGSLEDQQSRLTRYAHERGLEIAAFYSDDTCGTPATRPGLDAMLTAMRSGQFGALIIDDLDRLSRDLGHANSLFDQFCANGVEVHVVSSGYGTSAASPGAATSSGGIALPPPRIR